MMIPAQVWYLVLVIGIPLSGLLIERVVRMDLRKRLAPEAIQKAASNVIFCGMLWAFVFLYRTYFSGVDSVANLAFLMLMIASPLLTVLSLVRLARVRMSHPAKRPIAMFCVLHLVGVGAYWVITNRRLQWW